MRSNDEIIDLLTILKEEKNLSISEIARQVGMAKSAVSRYFNKTREFPLNRADDFSKVFGIKPEFLLGFNIPDNSFEELSDLYKQLDNPRKNNVLSYTKEQLEEQNKVVTLPKKEEIDEIIEDDTLAAHLVDPNRKFTDDEIDGLKAFLNKAKEDYLKKNK